MKTSLLTILCCLASYALLGQECNFPLAPSNTCQNAPLLCDLDGYCSNNIDAVNSGTPNAFCGQVENNQWVAFLAGSETFIMEATVSNCNQGSGLQMQILSTNNCQNFTAVSNCIDPVTPNVPATLTATDLVIGQQYYLMIDGKGGDVCDYTLRLLEGSTLSPAEAIIEPAGSLCVGSELDLNSVGTSPNADLSFLWSTANGNIIDGITTPQININAPGDYQINIVDAGGCTDSAIINIPLEQLPDFSIATPDTLNCLTNLMVDLQANSNAPNADYNYLWSSTNGVFLAGETTTSPTVGQAGDYQLVVTDNITGCSNTDEVTVIADANTPIATLSGAGELNCIVPNITLSGSGSSTGPNFSYLWQTDVGNFSSTPSGLSATADAPGMYSLEVTNQINGCVATATTQITENAAVPESALFGLSQPCYQLTDGSISVSEVVSGTAPFRYALGDGNFQNDNTFSDLAAGTYPLSIQDVTGCQWDTLLLLNEQSEFLLQFDKDSEISLGCELTLDPKFNRLDSEIDTFIWSPHIDSTDNLRPTVRPLATIAYELLAIDKNGCTAESQTRIFVSKDRNVFFPNAFSPNNDGNNDGFFIHAGKDATAVLRLQVFNRWGSLVYELGEHAPNDPSTAWRGQFNLKDAPPGIYVYRAEIRFIDNESREYMGDILLMR